MTDTASRPLTAAHLLFGEDQDTEPALARALDDKGALGVLDSALRQVSQPGRRAADRQVAGVAHGLIDLDLGGMVVAGWRKEGELAAAAERTARTARRWSSWPAIASARGTARMSSCSSTTSTWPR